MRIEPRWCAGISTGSRTASREGRASTGHALPAPNPWGPFPLNMAMEGNAGFRAFNEGPRQQREVDFIRLRQLLAEGHPWNEELIRAISPQYRAQPVPAGS